MSKVQDDSPMSNVQCPRSQIERSEAAIQDGKADIGHGTLDIGLERGPVDFVLTVSDLRKSFSSPNGEKIEVLRGVSFSASPCEAVAIMGSSGAGKSTLLHLLGGLEAPDHGRIIAGKFSIDHARPSALAHFRNHRVGFIFQFHHLLPDLTAAENVSLPLMIGREGQREALRRGLETLKKVGLDDRSSHLVGNLSGGEQQRVAVCRALVTRPSLVLADEPTGNLDRGIGDEIAHSLISYAKEGQAVVVVATHSRGVAELCDRILVLRDGRLFNL